MTDTDETDDGRAYRHLKDRIDTHERAIKHLLDDDHRPDWEHPTRRDVLGLAGAAGAVLLGASTTATAETVITNNPTPVSCVWQGPQDATGYSLLNLGLLDLDDQRQGSDEPAGIVNVDGKLYRVVPA